MSGSSISPLPDEAAGRRNLSVRVARRLVDEGHDVVHVTGVGLGNTDDPEIFDWAVAQVRIVVTSDADFGGLLALGGATWPSVVLLRSSDHLTPDEQADLLLTALPLVVQDLEEGAVVSLTSERVRGAFAFSRQDGLVGRSASDRALVCSTRRRVASALSSATL